jgi:hypothetical protein
LKLPPGCFRFVVRYGLFIRLVLVVLRDLPYPLFIPAWGIVVPAHSLLARRARPCVSKNGGRSPPYRERLVSVSSAFVGFVLFVVRNLDSGLRRNDKSAICLNREIAALHSQ